MEPLDHTKDYDHSLGEVMYVQQALLNFSFVCELLEIFQNLHSASNIQFIWKGTANSAFSRKHN